MPIPEESLFQPPYAGLHFPVPRFDRSGQGIFRERIFTDSLFDRVRERLEQARRSQQATQ